VDCVRLGEQKRDARDRMSLLMMVRCVLCPGVGASLGGSWDLYQIFGSWVLLLYDCSETRRLIWLLKKKLLRKQRMVQERRRCVLLFSSKLCFH
jgi:hypothetical protein